MSRIRLNDVAHQKDIELQQKLKKKKVEAVEEAVQ
jgi:hypothetical protein